MQWSGRKCASAVEKDAFVISDVRLPCHVPFGTTKYQLICCAAANLGVRRGALWSDFSYKIALPRAHIAHEHLFGRERGARRDLGSRRSVILLTGP